MTGPVTQSLGNLGIGGYQKYAEQDAKILTELYFGEYMVLLVLYWVYFDLSSLHRIEINVFGDSSPC